LELAPSKALAEQLAKNEEQVAALQRMAARLEDRLQDLGQNGHQWEETKEAVDEFNRVMASDDQEKIGAIRIRLNGCLKKLIERVEVGPEGVNVIPRGALPVPKLARQVARDGSFTFVSE
jgi:predicted acetyltransferase